MDETTVQACLDSVSGWVLDEGKVVSYAWLSNELSIPANDAKRLLFAFVEKCAEPLDVQHLVSGQLKKTGAVVVRLLPKHKVAAFKTRCAHVHSEHVYSVQAAAADVAAGDAAPPAAQDARKDVTGRTWSATFVQSRQLVDAQSAAGAAFRSNGASAVRNNITVKPPRNVGMRRAHSVPMSAAAAGADAGSAASKPLKRANSAGAALPMTVRKAPGKSTTPGSFFAGHTKLSKSASVESSGSAGSAGASKAKGKGKGKGKGKASFFGSATARKGVKKSAAPAPATKPAPTTANDERVTPAGRKQREEVGDDRSGDAKPKSKSKSKGGARRKIVVEESDDEDMVVGERIHAALDLKRELVDGEDTGMPAVDHRTARQKLADEQDAEDALEFGGAASEGEGEEAGAKVEEEEDGPDLRDELDSESPRKAKSKKRQRPGASKKQGGAKRARKADYESDEEAGISVIKTGSPVRDPSSKFFTQFKVTPSPAKKASKKRMVTKTFMDEEGFMVTENVWEDDPDAEDSQSPSPSRGANTGDVQAEAPTPGAVSPAGPRATKGTEAPPKRAPKPAAKKARPAAKAKQAKPAKKQASLMSFFGK